MQGPTIYKVIDPQPPILGEVFTWWMAGTRVAFSGKSGSVGIPAARKGSATACSHDLDKILLLRFNMNFY